MKDDLAMDRARALGALDETSAAIGAALCTGDVQGREYDDLVHVQDTLALIGECLQGSGMVAPRLLDLTEQIRRRGAERAHGQGNVGCAVGGYRPVRSHSVAAGLLRLARTVAQRAGREVIQLPSGAAREHARDCLDEVPVLLDLVAQACDADEERSIPIAFCGAPEALA